MFIAHSLYLLQFGSTRVVFLNKFIQELVNYGGHFSDFQDVAASAGSAAQVLIFCVVNG